jgi:uncharacterized protein (DUF305 family)
METLLPRWPAVALMLVLPATGCGARGPGGGATDSAAGRATPSAAELEALYWARVDSARTRYTEADVRFMTDMIAHHAQAIVMSRLAPEREASRSIQTLAARIINAQQDEIEIMQQWLRDRGEGVPEVHIMGTTLMVHGAGDHAMHMPGMITDAELQELASAEAAVFDRLFLMYMIRHHRGAITMVRDLFAIDGAGQDPAVFKFASDVHVDQATEVARMELMLAALPPVAGSP